MGLVEALKVAADEIVIVPVRGDKRIRVTPHMYDTLRLLREHLKQAARARRTVTYGEATAITNRAYAPNGWGPALDVLSEDCFRRDEPSLAALVVRSDVGEVGSAFIGDASDERQACFDYWAR